MAEAPPPTTPPPEETPVLASEPTARAEAVPHLRFKAALLLGFTLLLIVGTALFLLRARGFFEPKQTLVLVTDNSEGVAAGMDLTFSGFPIGTVRSVSLGEQGNVRIKIEVIKRDAKWLRTSSVFTLVRSLVGGSQLRAYSGVLTDPPLPEGAERPVLRGDANEELQRVIGTARDLIANLNDMTASGSELNQSLANVKAFTQKLQSRQGALHAVLGNEEDARKLVQAIDGANAAIARADRLMGSADRLVNNADREVFGPEGLTREARATLRQVQGILADTRGSLQRVDALLQDAQGITADVKSATGDLGSLRSDVEANLRKVEDLINELNRKWPFNKEREVQLP
jgi:phospholipid/cholesterol/gamma-HCH transport system substrate-binding protein